MVTLQEFTAWLNSQPSSVHGLVLKHASDGRCFTDFPAWFDDFKREYDSTDWSCFPSSHGTIEAPSAEAELWRAKALVDLYEWMKVSDDYDKTVKTWAEVYIQCGTCARGFSAWYENCEIGPEDDLLAWLQAARNIVIEKHWI